MWGAEPRQASRLGVGEDADGVPPAREGGPCSEVVVSAECGVVSDLAAEVSFERVALRQDTSDLQVDESSPGLRERPVRALAHQIVREVVAGAARGRRDDQDAVLLQLAHRGEQVARRHAARLREPIEIEPAAHRGRPRHHVACDRIEPRQALVDHRGERIGDDAVAAGQRAGDLDGEERMSAAPREDLRGVDGAGVLLDEERHLRFVQGREGPLDEPSLASERAEETLDRGVVAEFRAPRPRRDEDSGDGTARHVVQERRRRLVEPLQVVEHDAQRGALGHAGDEARDGFEEPVAVDAGPVGPELGEARRQLGAQALDRPAERDGAESVDPGSVGPDHLAFEAAARKDGPPRGADRVADDLEEARLADARLAEEDDRGRRGPVGRRGHVVGDRRTLRGTSDERLACRSRSEGRGSTRRRRGRRRSARGRRSHEGAGVDEPWRRPGAQLRGEDARARLVLREGLSFATEPREQHDHIDVCGLRERIDRDAGTRVRQRRLGRPGEALDECREDRHAKSPGGLALGDAPLVVAVAVG